MRSWPLLVLLLGVIACQRSADPFRQTKPEERGSPPELKRTWNPGACLGLPTYEATGCYHHASVYFDEYAIDDAKLLAAELSTNYRDYPSRMGALRAYVQRHRGSIERRVGVALLYSAHGQHEEAIALLDQAGQQGALRALSAATSIALDAGRCDLALLYQLPALEDPSSCFGSGIPQCDRIDACKASTLPAPLPGGDPPFPPPHELLGEPSTLVGAAASEPRAEPAAAVVGPVAGAWARRIQTAPPVSMRPGGKPLAVTPAGDILLMVGQPTSSSRLMRMSSTGVPLGAAFDPAEPHHFACGLAPAGVSLWMDSPATRERADIYGDPGGQRSPESAQALLLGRNADGRKIWDYQLRGRGIRAQETLAAVALNQAGDAVLVTAPGKLSRVAANGEIRWALPLEEGFDTTDAALDKTGMITLVGGRATPRSRLLGEPFRCTPDAGDVLAKAIREQGTAWIARLDPSGRPLWVRCAHGFGAASMLAVDASGAATVAGTFRRSLDLGAGPLRAQGKEDAFVARFAADGQLLWSQRLGASGQEADPTGRDDVTALALDAEGGVVVAVRLNRIHEQRLLGAALLVRLDARGNRRWERLLPGASARSQADHRFDPLIHGATFDAQGGVLVAGTSQPAVAVDGITLGATGPGEPITFLARIPP